MNMAHNHQEQKVLPTENDVLCGRGVNIAHHPGNERFRTLVNTKRDVRQKDPNSATEKRQLAEEIIRHIKSLNPPGRFLKRECPPGRRSSSRGKNGTGLDLSGTWEVVTDREAIKKTCQALRDSARTDRTGYAVGVVAPPDVALAAEKAGVAGLKREAPEETTSGNGENGGGRVSPSVENAASWLKKQKFPPSDQQQVGTVANPDGGMPMMPMPSQSFGTSWNANGAVAYSTELQPQQSGDPNAQSQQLLDFQGTAGSLAQGMGGTPDWGAQGALPQQENLAVDLGSPGDPGALNITEL